MVGLDPHAIKELKNMFREFRKWQNDSIGHHMLDSVEDYWDLAHIMVNGSIKATKFNRDGSDEKP